MAKYEIMVVIDGGLKATDAKKTMTEIKSNLSKVHNLKVTDLGQKDLSYPIKKVKSGYYFVFNFETEDTNIINEFRRLTFLNKNVLRHLIINLEKDYGYRSTVNPKKVNKSNYRKEIFKKVQDKINEEKDKAELQAKNTTSVKLTDI